MRHGKNLDNLWTYLLCLLLAVTGCTDTVVSTDVNEQQKISAITGRFEGNLDPADRFGSAISNIGDLEGDGVTDLAVGAPLDDDNGLDRGAVWILFMDDDGRVDLEQKISDDAGDFDGELDNNDNFGGAVAGIGDLDGDGIFDLAVGAPLDDDGDTDRGAVWILFLKSDGTVRQFQKISDTAGGFDGELDDDDQFGGAVADIGDLDGDGVADLAVGAENDSDGGNGKGAVWVLFINLDGTVKTAQKISSREGDFEDNLGSLDHFGSAVAGIGDLNNDGTNDLAVGAKNDDDGGLDRGAVWILFLNSDGTVASEQKISQREGEFNGELANGDQFGAAIANIGDMDGDGTVDLAVGANMDDDGGMDRGAIWILFMKDNGEVNSQVKISSTEGKFDGPLVDGVQFGSSATGIGNLDRKNARDLAVGAPLDNDGGTEKGAVWILFMEKTKTELENGFFTN